MGSRVVRAEYTGKLYVAITRFQDDCGYCIEVSQEHLEVRLESMRRTLGVSFIDIAVYSEVNCRAQRVLCEAVDRARRGERVDWAEILG